MSADLNARVRVEAAAAGRAEITTRSNLDEFPEGVSLVLLDLDAAGDEVLLRAEELIRAAPTTRWVGYFSHVDEALGRRAAEAGIEAFPRGRFWKALPGLFE